MGISYIQTLQSAWISRIATDVVRPVEAQPKKIYINLGP